MGARRVQVPFEDVLGSLGIMSLLYLLSTHIMSIRSWILFDPYMPGVETLTPPATKSDWCDSEGMRVAEPQ